MSSDTPHAPPPTHVMFRLITGLWASQAAGTLAELAIPDHLGDGAKTAAELARLVGSDERATYRLLRACASLGMLEHAADDRFSLTPLGATLRSDIPGSMRGMAIAQTAPGHWLPWGRLREAVKSGQRQTPAALGSEIFEYYGKNPNEARAFSGAMADLSSLVARELVRVAELGETATVVDVGGAHGTLVAALLQAGPGLRGVLLDLPHVVEGARQALAAKGLAARCEVLAGNFFEKVPTGDVYVLKQVLHDWSDAECVSLLKNCAASMKPNARLLVVEMVIPDDRTPTPAQLMDLNMLVMLPGRERTASEYRSLFEQAGLTLKRVIPTHSPFQIVEAAR